MRTGVLRILQSSMASKIHLPLPATPRDSQRLLALLNESFKQQLDRKHLADSSSPEHYANLHLESVLTNPLFNAKPRTHGISTSKSQHMGQSLGQLQNHVKYPMDAFKERVSQGTTDLDEARLCLSIQYDICMTSPATTPREAMQSCGAASTILQWLWSSGIEDTGTFLENPRFIAFLVPFLVADGQHSLILRWIQRSHYSSEMPFPRPLNFHSNRAEGFLLKRLVREEIRIGDGLESAINLFLWTVADRRSSWIHEGGPARRISSAAWALTHAIRRFPKPAELKPTIIHAFLKTMSELNRDSRLQAFLCVDVQEAPTPWPALTYFQGITFRQLALFDEYQRAEIVQLGLRAAELFLQCDCQTEAFWIMNYLQATLGPITGRRSNPTDADITLKGLHAEERSLRGLDELALQ